ncbi:PGPGW domain-containing protein [Magnetospirillum sp. UT-4]|uniref:PGPGW domain-containing protein n=1 Tax=Magnetospirillum sp. UT-4 TaxID=2681467 RepID=UPI00137C410D|nr:PGPGW domain-containing protein [Magnetospirillum sp. UT-4]CAA7616441.1 conserved exported hypothetical protein [Magnetospirillum sp. UT-4]
MKRPAARLLKIVFGWAFIVLGVLGLFLPILQGVLFLAIGLAILAQEQPWAHRLLMRLRHRFPHAAHVLDDARHKAQDWLHRITARRRRPPRPDPPTPDPPDGPRA